MNKRALRAGLISVVLAASSIAAGQAPASAAASCTATVNFNATKTSASMWNVGGTCTYVQVQIRYTEGGTWRIFTGNRGSSSSVTSTGGLTGPNQQVRARAMPKGATSWSGWYIRPAGTYTYGVA
jgi:hypothetical protein